MKSFLSCLVLALLVLGCDSSPREEAYESEAVPETAQATNGAPSGTQSPTEAPPTGGDASADAQLPGSKTGPQAAASQQPSEPVAEPQGEDAAKTGELKWLTGLEFDAALAQAAKEDKYVLLDFTGSDWCPPCKLLDKQVFTTDKFAAFAKKELVLVELDFPHQTPQRNELKEANSKLSDRFDVTAFPTVILLDKEGNEVGRQRGYAGTDAEGYIKQVKGWM